MHKPKHQASRHHQGGHAPSATSGSQPTVVVISKKAQEQQFSALVPDVNNAVVDFRRITKAAAKAACTAGEKLTELRETFGHDYQWLAAIRRRFGLSANEVWFFLYFYEKHGAQKDRLEPVVDIKLSELLAMIAEAWVAVETRQAGIDDGDRIAAGEDDVEVEEEDEDETTEAEEEEDTDVEEEDVDIEEEDIEVEEEEEDIEVEVEDEDGDVEEVDIDVEIEEEKGDVEKEEVEEEEPEEEDVDDDDVDEEIDVDDDDEDIRRSRMRTKPKPGGKLRRPR